MPVLEACGRHEAPTSKLFRLQREGLEKDFNPVTARLLGPGAAAFTANSVRSLSWAGWFPRAADCW